MRKKNGTWIWYPGDMEIYHGMLQNFQREERGYEWPAYWHMDDWNKNVSFRKKFDLNEATSFLVHGIGHGYVAVNGKKYPIEQKIECGEGKNEIEIFIGNMTGLPCVFVSGEVIFSDETWTSSNFLESAGAGTSSLFTDISQNPNEVPYQRTQFSPKEIRTVEKKEERGLLIDFGRMINGTLRFEFTDPQKEVTAAYGESEAEAEDLTWCYYKQTHVKEGTALRRRAFRYIFLPDTEASEIKKVTAIHEAVPLKVKASFSCDDEEMNRIWETAKETYLLCSGIFFIDGIKRDRWIWSGDAYQSYAVNPYLLFDEEIDKRTGRALRGNLAVSQHINTIVDYSMLWLLSVEQEYEMTGDAGYAEEMYPKMEAMMKLLMSQTDENGFVVSRKQDWIYIDWAEMDRTGPLAAEQVLLLACYRSMIRMGDLLHKPHEKYDTAQKQLSEKLFQFYWDNGQGAFIDSFESGKRHVTRHANIFAILFDIVNEEQKQSILKNVLENPDIPAITTPYFKFFELDAFAKLGCLDVVWNEIKSYWGGMLKRGAVTFWEEFDPEEEGDRQYAMYGDPFGKSLCHAWAASPIYFIGKYFLGVRPTAPGYQSYTVDPKTRYFKELDAVVPVKNGTVHITIHDGNVNVIQGA